MGIDKAMTQMISLQSGNLGDGFNWSHHRLGFRGYAATDLFHLIRNIHSNLHLVLETKAIQVLLEVSKAAGLEHVVKLVLIQTL